jgi:gamma-glutamylcyclotransferase (GGCT)/AIG2-like uncharacterized protein YtfP
VEFLFSYGSLRDEDVQRAIFGRRIKGIPDAVVGYRLGSTIISDKRAIAISGKAIHHILEPTGHAGDQIEGMLFQLSEEELKLADAYEDAAYSRIMVALRSGTDAWVYVKA